MLEVFSSINTAISLAQRLRDISKSVDELEYKNILADLINELADVKIEAASLKETIAELKKENVKLKSIKTGENEKPVGVRLGCYKFENDDKLYCSACWDIKKQKSMTNRRNIKERSCPVCKAVIGT